MCKEGIADPELGLLCFEAMSLHDAFEPNWQIHMAMMEERVHSNHKIISNLLPLAVS